MFSTHFLVFDYCVRPGEGGMGVVEIYDRVSNHHNKKISKLFLFFKKL